MSDKLKAADVLAKAVRELIESLASQMHADDDISQDEGATDEQQERVIEAFDYALHCRIEARKALTAYEASPAEHLGDSTLQEKAADMIERLYDPGPIPAEQPTSLDYEVSDLVSALRTKPAESQAAEGFAAGDWVPSAAKAIARWAYGYYNGNDCGSTDALKYWDGVGHQLPGPKWTIDVISQVLTGFAPTNQSQQLAAAQSRIAELEASKNFYLDGCANAEKISEAHINRAEKAESRVAVLEKALEGAKNAMEPELPHHSGLCVDMSKKGWPVTASSCECSPNKKQFRTAFAAILDALAAQPSREKEGDK